MQFVEKYIVMDQQSLPLWEGLKKHAEQNRVRLHVPGHGGGNGLPPELKDHFAGMAACDLTELPGLDDLFNPTGIINRAQELAASLWGADNTYFLVNGSSAGVLAMLLAVCDEGDSVLVPRNAHASVYHGLILSGAKPHYLPVASGCGFLLNVTVESVSEAFRNCPHARAILLTSPGYHGVCADIAAIAHIAAKYGALVLVDEAHGAHFGFHPELPPGCGQAADLRVQSWHKTLGALTPGAVLHRQGVRVDTLRLQRVLQWVQTSSPSYPLLLSLDAARKQMALAGEQLWARTLQAVMDVRAALGGRIPLLDRDRVREQGFDLDPTRLTLLTGKIGLDGREAAHLLAVSGIDVEMAGPDHLLAIFGPGMDKNDAKRVVKAFLELEPVPKKELPCRLPPQPDSRAVITPRQAALGPSTTVSPDKAVGLIAAAPITAYPPGIPLVAPGDLITQEISDYISAAGKAGVNLRGLNRQGCLCVCKGVGCS